MSTRDTPESDLNVHGSQPGIPRSASTAGAPPVATVDAQNPWLGLVSFTEETRGFFHGREEEAAELGRRVQRKLLTVLFGQSGLGKTSILQAGLVPRLRPEGFCPVYVRLDYDPHSPSPADQIKRAVFRATEAAGTWTQTGSAVTGETLWEFLHHRDDVLKDAGGRTLIPILIFDQFEEIFTLAQSDDAGRKRAQEFIADLADLVENRPPAALEARIDRDEADASRFDFARADYRILLSLREDYLAHLEGLKGQMPSVTQNRMRLARMTGPQAVAAVRAPAPQLVSETVAEAVVRFVAGGTDLARAEVEPSLLSLICRELNNARLARGEPEISANLLAGSRDTILSEFYERALAGQPEGVRSFIEDEMLTDSGFRESVAEERVRKAFEAAGAAPGALALLVDRRLLRVEDRLDLRRVEITHDVLCSVVSGSRSVRHEREALEESKRQLAAQEEREAAARRQLTRARRVAAVAVVLMLAALGSAIFGWLNLRRARAAEAEAQATRNVADKARAQSEKLIGFLLEDFYLELKPTGQIDLIGRLADKAVAYYEGLPAGLENRETKLYHGMALVRKADALFDAGRLPAARAAADQAMKIFGGLREEGDQSDAVTLGLALAMTVTVSPAALGEDRLHLQKAVALLRPIVAAGRATREAKLALGDMLQYLGHSEPKAADAYADCAEARKILAGMGALDLSDLAAASIYGDVTDSQSRFAFTLGRTDEAAKLSAIVHDLSEKVLVQRPGDLRAMRNLYYSANMLGIVALNHHDLAGAEAAQLKAVEAARYYVRFNPADSGGWFNLGSFEEDLAGTYAGQGRVADAVATLRESAALEQDPRNRTGINFSAAQAWASIEKLEAQRGNLRAAKAALAETQRTMAALDHAMGLDPFLVRIGSLSSEILGFEILAAEGDWAAIHARAVAVSDSLANMQIKVEGDRQFRDGNLRESRIWEQRSALRLGDFEEAAILGQGLLRQPLLSRSDSPLFIEGAQAQGQVRLGQALLGSGQTAAARQQLTAAVAFYREQARAGATGTNFRQSYGKALEQLALAQGPDDAGRAQRRVLLNEAMTELSGLSLEAQQLRDSRELLQSVGDALGARP